MLEAFFQVDLAAPHEVKPQLLGFFKIRVNTDLLSQIRHRAALGKLERTRITNEDPAQPCLTTLLGLDIVGGARGPARREGDLNLGRLRPQ